MPYTSEHKERSRQRILQSARTLFNRYGFEQVTIDRIMEGAGLTRGAFYAHFSHKEELYAEAVMLGLEVARSKQKELRRSGVTRNQMVRSLVDAYLGQGHLADVEECCPMVALPSDIARGGDSVKGAFCDVLGAMVTAFRSDPESDISEERAYAMATLCVGGMVLARACGDERLAEKILNAAHLHAAELLDQGK